MDYSDEAGLDPEEMSHMLSCLGYPMMRMNVTAHVYAPGQASTYLGVYVPRRVTCQQQHAQPSYSSPKKPAST